MYRPKTSWCLEASEGAGGIKSPQRSYPQVSRNILENLPTFLEWVHSFGGLKPWHRANGAIVAGRRLPSFGSGPFWLKDGWKIDAENAECCQFGSVWRKRYRLYIHQRFIFWDVYNFVQRFSFDWWQLVYRLAPSSMEKVSRRLGWLLTQSQPSRKSVLLGCFRDGLKS